MKNFIHKADEKQQSFRKQPYTKREEKGPWVRPLLPFLISLESINF